MTATDTPHRSLDREILHLALPAIGSGLTILAHYWVDTIWIGRLGDFAVAAVAMANFSVWIFGSVAALLGIGITALVARYIGAGHPSAASYVASQGARGTVLIAALAALAGWFLAPVIYQIAGREPEVSAAGVVYVRIYWLGGWAMLMQQALGAVFRGRGNTLTPFAIDCGGLVLNAVLDPILIFGLVGFPEMGVGGAALATVITQLVTMLVTYRLLRGRAFIGAPRVPDEDLRLEPDTRVSRRNYFGLDAAVLLRVVRIGLPISISGVVFSVIYMILSRVVEDAGGTAAVAGLGVGHRGEGLAFWLCSGYAAAAASLVGRRLGRRDPDAAARSAWRAVLQCATVCGLWGLVLYFFDEELVAIFLREGEASDHAASYYRVIAWGLVPQAVELVLEGAFGGAGLTVPPMLISVSLTSLRVPLAYWVTSDLGAGVTGIWWVICVTAILRGIVMALWFLRGSWKMRTV